MSHTEVDTVLGQALRMSAQERAEIAEKLIASLDDSCESDVEEAWQEEVQRRIRELDSGAAACVPWRKSAVACATRHADACHSAS